MNRCLRLYLFPGQGSQRVGMAREAFERGSNADVPAEAARNRDVLHGMNKDLLQIMDHGPLTELTATVNAQRAIFSTSATLFDVYAAAAPSDADDREYFLGHSLGEFTALYASRAIPSFKKALEVVNARADAMASYAAAEPFSMVALTPASVDDVRDDVGKATIANVNSTRQVVLSGHTKDVDDAVRRIKARKRVRAARLNVGGPFHTSLLASCSDDFRRRLNVDAWNLDRLRFVAHNASGAPHDASRAPETVKDALAAQMRLPVFFADNVTSVPDLHSFDRVACVEFGGHTLTPFVKARFKELGVLERATFETIETLDDAVNARR